MVVAWSIASLKNQVICPSICFFTESGLTRPKPVSRATSTRSSRTFLSRLTDLGQRRAPAWNLSDDGLGLADADRGAAPLASLNVCLTEQPRRPCRLWRS